MSSSLSLYMHRLSIIAVLSLVALVSAGCVTGSGNNGSMEVSTRDGGAKTVTFETTGEASYYGGKFHGRTTASGEVFDKNAMTAAHLDLPFGTRVRVTNVANGKSVVVRINDRFPGTKGRIIDLSEAAFALIAPLAQGVAQVEIQIVK